ncbi:mannose-1-phosphate guanylyltransferase/mannose-6-phosphate isomerase [Polycladidibacter hongkongensis]|uniref:mannose-1-phosphate guanylyltransferase/mannose-6-phosphate isomerase n=1 Tax=Polycladidibacter hongkongensis TaxID=1647556 RepID=UPI00082E48E5|nr:mannose-1-phosphate guanylyltransferase/mannose-6-phosphate isomerase [Pseudovibrio hongkongensis]
MERDKNNTTILPAILSGGFGSRLWPLSRRQRPKQFLPIFEGESLFQKTCKRTIGPHYLPPLVISNQDHRFLIGEQLSEIGVTPQAIVLEPEGKNTAAPAALAAQIAMRTSPDTLILLAPSDHLIADEAAFDAALQAAIPAAKSGTIVTFGIKPSEPHTGYGYIQLQNGERGPRASKVARFVEKPDLDTARGFLKEGGYLWNAGIFLFSARAMQEAFAQHAAQIWQTVAASLSSARADLDFLRLDPAEFSKTEAISFDYAIMEHAQNIACVPMDPRWSDLGSWSALWESMAKDENGNSSLGEALYEAAENCLVYSQEGLVSVVGLSDVLVVNTKDAVLVTSRDKAQDVKKIVSRLDAERRKETVHHVRAYRPWGWTEEIASGDRFRVQSMMIKPGEHQSLQRHMHRAEHWVVVGGTLEITIDDRTALVSENQSVYVPLGANHKLKNPGQIPVQMIEIQSGSHISEDDILRTDVLENMRSKVTGAG